MRREIKEKTKGKKEKAEKEIFEELETTDT